jgi:hypothetical protein
VSFRAGRRCVPVGSPVHLDYDSRSTLLLTAGLMVSHAQIVETEPLSSHKGRN